MNFIICVAGDRRYNTIDYCEMKIDDCDERAQCVLDQKKRKKKKMRKPNDGENFYKCKCRDLLTDISKIKGTVNLTFLTF